MLKPVIHVGLDKNLSDRYKIEGLKFFFWNYCKIHKKDSWEDNDKIRFFFFYCFQSNSYASIFGKLQCFLMCQLSAKQKLSETFSTLWFNKSPIWVGDFYTNLLKFPSNPPNILGNKSLNPKIYWKWVWEKGHSSSMVKVVT